MEKHPEYSDRSGDRTGESYTVLGGGFAGMAAAQRLASAGATVDLYERRTHLGGHASSMSSNGFTFDEGPHVSFTKIPEVKQLLADGVAGKYHEFASDVQNYFQGDWVKHPVQAHLNGLPPELVTRCVLDFLDASKRPLLDDYPDYAAWLLAQYGETFSKEFPFRYTRKYWTVEPSEMATSWIGPRMYRPSLEEVIRGAVAPVIENKHYIKAFRYPEEGGFGAYTRALVGDADYHTGWTVERVDVARRRVIFESGEQIQYERLISSLPLPELVTRIVGAPTSVLDAVSELVCTSLAIVDVGVQRSEGFPKGHWLYFYDEDVCFARASYPHLLAASNVPEGHGSMQVEVYYTQQKPLTYEDVHSRVIEDMRKVGMLQSEEEVVFSQCRHVKYGNVLYDHRRDAALSIINTYLDELGIVRCGRYGLWNYHWTDESIVSGWDAAQMAMEQKS